LKCGDTWFFGFDRLMGTSMVNHLLDTKFHGQIILALIAITLGLFGSAAKAAHGEQTWVQAQKSVVVVNPVWPGYDRPGFGAPKGTAPAGSGVYFSVDGKAESAFIITAAHVVEAAESIEIIDFSGKIAKAVIHSIDARRDIAILRTKLIGISISIRQDEPVIGSHVCALGNSFGLGTGMTCGIVSAVRRSNIGFNDIEDFIQTDAAVNPGMSGGALVDPQGRLLGLIDGIFTKEADIDAGVNFAISVPLIQQSLASQLKAGVQF
jgi:S1-C subfamily serine protease